MIYCWEGDHKELIHKYEGMTLWLSHNVLHASTAVEVT
jgi:hypothetical protein